MKFLLLGLLLPVFGTGAFAQAPDPMDSVILESKTVAPGAHPGAGGDTAAYVYLKVYITNKDSLTFLTLALIERSTYGGAYITLARPRNFNGTVNRLTNTLQGGSSFDFPLYPKYNSSSPDSMVFAVGFDPADPATIEPPNGVRKGLLELKFDSVWSNPGTVEFDTGRVVIITSFTNTVPVDLPVNFAKSVVTVVPKGDLDLDGQLSAADVVLMLDCIFQTEPSARSASPCDLNCDRRRSQADVVWELYAVFLGRPFPC